MFLIKLFQKTQKIVSYFFNFIQNLLLLCYQIICENGTCSCRKQNRLFQNSKFGFSEKLYFKFIFELKTVYFAYKPISDSLF